MDKRRDEEIRQLIANHCAEVSQLEQRVEGLVKLLEELGVEVPPPPRIEEMAEDMDDENLFHKILSILDDGAEANASTKEEDEGEQEQ